MKIIEKSFENILTFVMKTGIVYIDDEE